jgi:hypothetical protein
LAETEDVQHAEGGESSSGQSAVIQTRSRQGQAEGLLPIAVEPHERPLGTPGSTPQPDLLFVTYTGPSDIASRDIKHVRSHVMRQHVRRRRTRAEEAETSGKALTEAKRLRINLLPGAGRVDPFGALSVTMTRAMSRLFDHCKRPCRHGFAFPC